MTTLRECTYCSRKFSKSARSKHRRVAYKQMAKTIKNMEKQPNVDIATVKQLKRAMVEITKPAFIKKMDKLSIDACNQAFCNTDCIDTIFEKGKTIPPNVLKQFTGITNLLTKPVTGKPKSRKRLNKQMIEYITKKRKDLFEGKNDILDNSFYTGLGKTRINKLKNEGAISGCIQR